MKEFRGIHLSIAAQKMVNKLTSCGLTHAEVLMFLRTIGDNGENWRYFIRVLVDNKVLSPAFNVDSVVNNAAVRSLYRSTVSNGLIKNFGEGTKEIDWFLANFCEESEICRKRKNITNLWHFLFRRSVRFFPDSDRRIYPKSYAVRFNQIYDSFSGIANGYKAAAREYLRETISHTAFITWHSAVYSEEGPDEEDFQYMSDAIAPHIDEILKILLVDLFVDEEFSDRILEVEEA